LSRKRTKRLCATKVEHSLKTIEVISYYHKDIAHVAMQGTSEPHEMLPGTEGDSDNQKVPPSRSSTFNFFKNNIKNCEAICSPTS
jgi:hypothetical protein